MTSQIRFSDDQKVIKNIIEAVAVVVVVATAITKLHDKTMLLLRQYCNK
jgi:hypothetical protein